MNSEYYTHRPYIISELNKLIDSKKSSTISILELGVGDGSSEVFNEFSQKHKNISIIGLETDYLWYNNMKAKYELPNYQIRYLESWQEPSYLDILNNNYDLIFVDQNPWEARIDAINKLYGNFQALILHDYDFYNPKESRFDIGKNSFFGKYLEKYHISEFHSQLPPTLVMSLK
jgi:hypothetical protein